MEVMSVEDFICKLHNGYFFYSTIYLPSSFYYAIVCKLWTI